VRYQPSSTQRGYGQLHRKLRLYWEPIVATGTVACWRCGEIIGPREPWDLGHDDQDRTRYRGPECRRCNRATKSRQGDPAPRRARWA